MKFALVTCTLIAVLIISSCSKDNTKGLISFDDSNNTIRNKWNVVADSTYTGVGIENHLVNYEGKEGDYFDFRPDSNLYIKEGAITNIIKYTIVNDTTLIITTFGVTVNGVPDTTHIINLNTHSAILLTPFILTPGGIFGRKVQLSR